MRVMSKRTHHPYQLMPEPSAPVSFAPLGKCPEQIVSRPARLPDQIAATGPIPHQASFHQYLAHLIGCVQWAAVGQVMAQPGQLLASRYIKQPSDESHYICPQSL